VHSEPIVAEGFAAEQPGVPPEKIGNVMALQQTS